MSKIINVLLRVPYKRDIILLNKTDKCVKKINKGDSEWILKEISI